MPTRVFISFDYDHDSVLKEFLIGQSKLPDSPFQISDTSITVATPNWRQVARNRIKSSDTVAVICGQHTHTAAGVAAEVEIAQEESISYFLLKGYKDVTCYKPTSAYSSDGMYPWTWDNLKILVGGGR
ncbi:hypothetical protein AB0K11_24690 [Mycobacterium sp. NPDC050551]|uniref:TIR domain-containing protein n=1 Tax=Mycobacterium sp. NPDC050551 TaxID=3155407 RepID=UPI003449630E